MTSDPVIDLEAFLEPISSDHPCGESDSAADSLEAQIGTRYEQLLEDFRSGLDSDSAKALSDFVRDIERCFRDDCKSITLAFRLPGLLAMEYGLVGFRDGMRCIHGLYEKYANEIFPNDPDKLKNVIRHGVFFGGDDDVTNQYRLFLLTPITQGSEPLPYFKLRNARFIKPDSQVIGEFANAASRSSPEFYEELVQALDDIIDLARKSNALFAKQTGDSSVSLANFRFLESLEKMRGVVHQLADEHCPGYPILPEEPESAEQVAAPAGGGAAVAAKQAAAFSGEITTRQQAVEVLQKAADFFAKTEPHSPVSYSLMETISWTKLKLPDLWKKLLDGDENQLEQLARRVGFKYSAEEHDSEESD